MIPLPFCLAILLVLHQAITGSADDGGCCPHGKLSVKGSKLVDKDNNPVQLRGMSLFWSNFPEGKGFFNEQTVQCLKCNWHADIVCFNTFTIYIIVLQISRFVLHWASKATITIYKIRIQNCPKKMQSLMRPSKIACESNSKWFCFWTNPFKVCAHRLALHIIGAIQRQGRRFLQENVRKVCRQMQLPLRRLEWANPKWLGKLEAVPWRGYQGKSFLLNVAIIPIIPSTLGNPRKRQRRDCHCWHSHLGPRRRQSRRWSDQGPNQCHVSIATQRKNILQRYTLHFYAGEDSHKQPLRDKAEAAIKKGLPIFVTEYGTTPASGDGTPNLEETQKW